MGSRGLRAARLAAISGLALALGVATFSTPSNAKESETPSLGMDVETVDVTGGKPAVTVYRGRLEPRAPNPYVLESGLEPERESLAQLGGGNTVWFLDETNGTLRGCRLVQTADTGRRAVRCWSRGSVSSER